MCYSGCLDGGGVCLLGTHALMHDVNYWWVCFLRAAGQLLEI